MSVIFLVEITAYDPDISATRVLRYSSGMGYSGSGAPAYYEPRVQQPALLQRTAFGSGTTTGAVETGYGSLVLNNADGGLDDLLDYGFDGRTISVLMGDDDEAYSLFGTLFVGTIEQARFTMTTVEFLIRDRLFELDKPLQTTKYQGNNSLPAGLEGVDDIKGQPKPKAFGVAKNISPPMVNTSRLIVQLSDAPIFSATVYDNGVQLTAASAYTSVADMESNAPAAGAVRVLSHSSGSYARLGSSPAGQITVDVTQGSTTASRTAAQILQAIATGPGGISAGDVEAADVTALDTASSAVCGFWTSQEMTVRDAMNQIASSAGAWFGFDRLGKLRMKRLEAPSGSPVVTFKILGRSEDADSTTLDIIEIEKINTEDEGRSVPAYSVILDYERNYTVQTDGIAGSVTGARREFLRNEYRTVNAKDVAVQTKHILSPELKFSTLLNSVSDAQTEANRLLNLYKVRRDRLRIRTRLENFLTSNLDLGSVVEVETNRFGFDSGKLFTIIGIRYDVEKQYVDFDLWG